MSNVSNLTSQNTPRLKFEKLSTDPSSSSKIGLMIKHWIKELIDFYLVPDLETFVADFNKQLRQYPVTNGFSASNTYRAKVTGDSAIIERHYADLHKEPVEIYSISYRKEVVNG